MEMTIPVTLIVKAPNQQIEDQTVKCELSWTIHRLKSHLSEVYPSRPARDEQKLIYSGQLLSDSVVLKDVLRNYDSENTHTVHLVCTPTRNYRMETPKTKPNKPKEQSQGTTPTDLGHASTSTSDLPQPATPVSTPQVSPTFRQVWGSFTQAQPNIMDPAQYAMQAALLQQAYMQYLNQYMQMMQNQSHRVETQSTVQESSQPAAAAAPAAPAEPANNAAEVAGDDQDADDLQIDRDWLDWFYIFSRVLVLFSIVYFYSSPLRFALVLLLGIGMYMYQMGFFRAQPVNNNEARRPENNNVPGAEAATTSAHATNDNNVPVPAEERPTMLNIMWTFFTTFFASLIPEIPNAV